MKPIIYINIIVVILSCILNNEFLKYYSYIFYGIQLILMIPFLLRKMVFAKNIFLPSFFALTYYLVNMFLGGFLVPNNYGFNLDLNSRALEIKNYNQIVPYFLISNMILFLLSYYALKKLSIKAVIPQKLEGYRLSTSMDYLRLIISFSIFLILSYWDIYMVFAFQLSILIIIFSYATYFKKRYRYIIYIVALFLMVLFNFEDKREIIIVLLLIFFMETYYSRWILQFTFKKILVYSFVIIVFLSLIITSSILRGYGEYNVTSVRGAVTNIPNYVRSDFFVDGLTDNLELNYSYGNAVLSMDLIINGEIPYQYGLTVFKILFLPIPRSVFPNKPESIMQLYTKKYDIDFWQESGSFPIIFPCDMFLNFSYLGILPFAFIWFIINRMFINFHFIKKRDLKYFSYVFIFITILFFARGSGIELYLLYYLFALPIFILYMLLKNTIEKAKKTTALKKPKVLG